MRRYKWGSDLYELRECLRERDQEVDKLRRSTRSLKMLIRQEEVEIDDDGECEPVGMVGDAAYRTEE